MIWGVWSKKFRFRFVLKLPPNKAYLSRLRGWRMLHWTHNSCAWKDQYNWIFTLSHSQRTVSPFCPKTNCQTWVEDVTSSHLFRFVSLVLVHTTNPGPCCYDAPIPTRSTAHKHRAPPSPHPSPPALMRKARLTLIGCTDPFLWIWIKVRQATHAKLCQAGRPACPHQQPQSHRKVGGRGEREGGRKWRERDEWSESMNVCLADLRDEMGGGRLQGGHERESVMWR